MPMDMDMDMEQNTIRKLLVIVPRVVLGLVGQMRDSWAVFQILSPSNSNPTFTTSLPADQFHML